MIIPIHDELLIGLESDEERLLSLFEFGVTVPNQEYCYQKLKLWCGEDFGYDVEAWKEWFADKDNEQIFYDNMRKFFDAKKSRADNSS